MRLRQIALVSSDIGRARSLLTSIFNVPVIFEDPAVGQWGLENFLVPLGGDIIEVVAPTRPGTTAGRLLEKRGEGGYMIIMQTHDAARQRTLVENSGKSKVIFSHPFSHSYPSWGGVVKDEGWCIQYHPKGFKGGMMPELDSHAPCQHNPTPLLSRFSPWHACGKRYDEYVEAMKATSHLHLLGCVLRVAAENDPAAAASQWSDAFEIPSEQGRLAFTNASVEFVHGDSSRPEGLEAITVGVATAAALGQILDRARKFGLEVNQSRQSFDMLGCTWRLVPVAHRASRL